MAVGGEEDESLDVECRRGVVVVMVVRRWRAYAGLDGADDGLFVC